MPKHRRRIPIQVPRLLLLEDISPFEVAFGDHDNVIGGLLRIKIQDHLLVRDRICHHFLFCLEVIYTDGSAGDILVGLEVEDLIIHCNHVDTIVLQIVVRPIFHGRSREGGCKDTGKNDEVFHLCCFPN